MRVRFRVGVVILLVCQRVSDTTCSYDDFRNKQPVQFGDWEAGTSDWEKMEDKERGFETLEFYQDIEHIIRCLPTY